MLWTYAEPDGAGGWKLLGGGTYDAAANTYGQGAYNADDVSRAAVVYLRHCGRPATSKPAAAYALLRGLAYLQTVAATTPGTSCSGCSPTARCTRARRRRSSPTPPTPGRRTGWRARSGPSARAPRPSRARPGLRRVPAGRLELALDALDRQVLDPGYGRFRMVDGLRWPAWLIVDGADATPRRLRPRRRRAGDPRPPRGPRPAPPGQGVAALQQGAARRGPTARCCRGRARARTGTPGATRWPARSLAARRAAPAARWCAPRSARPAASRRTCSPRAGPTTAGCPGRPTAPRSPTARTPRWRTWCGGRAAGRPAFATSPAWPPPGTSATTPPASRPTTRPPA